MPRTPSRLLLLAAVACCGLSACSTDKVATPPVASSAPQLVGRVGSVSADRTFVAIQSYGKWSVAAGTVLTTRGPDGRTANLLVTGEALGRFAAADVQAGVVEEGDAVFAPAATEPKPSEDPAETDPATPPAAASPPAKPSEPVENKPARDSGENNQSS